MTHWLYILNAWIHIVAAMAWIGGMLFLAFILVPTLRSLDARDTSARLIRDTGHRFRYMGYILFVILLITGIGNLHMRGIGFDLMASAEFWHGPYGQTLAYKLVLFVVMMGLGVVHDFVIGRRALNAMREQPDGAPATHWRRMASWMGRLNLLIALLIALLGVMLVRGRPW